MPWTCLNPNCEWPNGWDETATEHGIRQGHSPHHEPPTGING